MTDHKIMELLKANEVDKAFDALYDYYGNVKKYILKNNGDEEDAKDIFQETLVIFYDKTRNTAFTLSSSVKTYVIAIAKNLWLKKLTRTPEHILLQEDLDDRNEEEDLELQYNMLDKVLKNLGDKCLEVLKLFYFEEKSMEEIAKLFGFNNEHVARTQKYKCLERARKMADQELRIANDELRIESTHNL